MSKTIIGYCRVSTLAQGVSGLGLESQHESITGYCASHGYEIKRFINEVASGKLDETKREGLAAAMESGYTIIVAKLDRLSRDVGLIDRLTKSRDVSFECVDLGPSVDSMSLGVHAVVAQNVRDVISQRTRQALAAKRERGEPLGNMENLEANRHKGHDIQRHRAVQEVERFRTLFERYVGQSFSAIARDLNVIGHKTVRGGKWHHHQVNLAMHRLDLV